MGRNIVCEEFKTLTKNEIINIIKSERKKRADEDIQRRRFISDKDRQINQLEALVGKSKNEFIKFDRMEKEITELRAVASAYEGLIKHTIKLSLTTD